MFSSSSSQVSTAANYIEDVFSTYLYTGDGSTQAISNGIDLSTKGGMVWIKSRKQTDGSTSPIGEHGIWDTARGVGTSGSINKALSSNSTAAENLGFTDADYVSAFNSTGFSVQNSGGTTTHRIANHLFQVYASWTFRKQAKFFDVVTYTGTGSNTTISHNLGSVPGCIIVKRTDAAGYDWRVYHRSLTSAAYSIQLNATTAEGSAPTIWNSTAPTSTVFSVGTNASVNASGGTYVAYLFAHDAGGFGASGSDNVISCGSFNTGGSGSVSVTLNYEPQWVMMKRTDSTSDWIMLDTMRGWANEETVSSNDLRLYANSSGAESADSLGFPSATGFQASGFGLNQTWIYIAIRRGPMKTPTSGTSVFVPVAVTGATGGVTMTTNFPADAVLDNKRNGTGEHYLFDRLRSAYGTNYLSTSSTAVEGNGATQYMILDSNTTVINKDYATDPGNTVVSYIFRRAPGFFDVVCYTGTGSATTVSHNLGVEPELIIVKSRSAINNWVVYCKYLSTPESGAVFLNLTNGRSGVTDWNNTLPTSSVFSLGSVARTNGSGTTFVAYLFATVAGVSKVGSYTGTAALQTIDCGFSAGARFVLIKRTDSTGDWYVWDSARGISSGNDPYLLLNSTAAEVTGTNYVDTTSVGFQVTAAAPAGINASGGSYIFLAVS